MGIDPVYIDTQSSIPEQLTVEHCAIGPMPPAVKCLILLCLPIICCCLYCRRTNKQFEQELYERLRKAEKSMQRSVDVIVEHEDDQLMVSTSSIELSGDS